MLAPNAGRFPVQGIRSNGNGVTTIPVTTRRPICSIRPKQAFNGSLFLGYLIPVEVDCYADHNVYVEIVLNGVLTGASFLSNGISSAAEIDVSASDIVGGQVIDSFYITISGGGGAAHSTQTEAVLDGALSIVNGSADNLSVVMTYMGTAANTAVAMTWAEHY